MPSKDKESLKRISVDLPTDLVNHFDQLKEEWGLRRRGAVLERLLEEIFGSKDLNQSGTDITKTSANVETFNKIIKGEIKDENLLENSIVLIDSNVIENTEKIKIHSNSVAKSSNKEHDKFINKSKAIDLPAFVSKRTEVLKKSLGRSQKTETNYNSIYNCITKAEVDQCIKKARLHWKSLYGQNPGEEVLEAAMIWLARDIWPNVDDSQNLPFTWHAASNLMISFCSSWITTKPTFDHIIVMAGIFEDPFAADTLQNRIPTLIRRFVNSFKRRGNVTSFQTLESTMTVLGALKLLDLPTTAGKSVSLSTVREAYKTKAMLNHPDSGGSTDIMRKINEAYQLLKDLYQ